MTTRTTEISARILKETEKAIQIETFQGGRKSLICWLPKSQIECWSRMNDQHAPVTIELPTWLINSKVPAPY